MKTSRAFIAAAMFALSQDTFVASSVATEPANEKATYETAKKFFGTWKGTMESPTTARKFPVTIRIEEFAVGKWSGTLDHDAPLDADGKLLGISLAGNTMIVAQTIFRGRERCLDGLNLLTLIDNDTIERVWVDPATGQARDKGTLKRQAK